MKAMFLGFAGAIAVAIVAGVILGNVNPDSSERYASASVRLD